MLYKNSEQFTFKLFIWCCLIEFYYSHQTSLKKLYSNINSDLKCNLKCITLILD